MNTNPKTLFFSITIIFFISCNNKPINNKDTKENIENETPEVLDNKNSDLSSISKRYDSDIISKLYNEAVEKNSNLEKLNNEIRKISYIKNDSLSNFYKFSQTNNNYWSNATKYINQIQDSILKESTLEFFKSLESQYLSSIADFDQKNSTIKERDITLNDYQILMKLSITHPMIKNYQLNERPDIKVLEKIISDYDKLIKETKEYTNTIK